MTRYQRGETMEGWNDCPVPMAPSKPGSTTKSRKRLSSLYTNPATPAPASTKTPIKMPPMPPVSKPQKATFEGTDMNEGVNEVSKVSEGVSEVSKGVNKGINKGINEGVNEKANQAVNEDGLNNTEINKSTTNNSHAKSNIEDEQNLRDFCQSSNFSDADRAFFAKRLVEPYPTLSGAHQNFIATIIKGLKAQEKRASLKAQILNYMMVHNGVSTWCVPLKKLVEVSS